MPNTRSVTMQTLTHEEAYDLAAKLTDQIRHDDGNTTVFRGSDATLGRIFIVIPALGNPLLLPIALQLADV